MITLMFCICYLTYMYFTSQQSVLFVEKEKLRHIKSGTQKDIVNNSLILDKKVMHRNTTEKWNKISFLKVPKCGSSTTACIFIRFGINNNLSMFLPRETFISKQFQQRILKDEMHFDMFVIHTNYNFKFFTHIVQNPKIIGTIRKPENRLISHAFYFKLYKKHNTLRGLSDQDFINKVIMNTRRYGVDNVIGSFFGLNDHNIPRASLQKKLWKLNDEFACVLLIEMFDESLIILKRLLRWSVFDIIYVPKKARHKDVHLNTSQIRHLKQTNKIEYILYNFFRVELERKIKHAGDDFDQEVAYFKHILKQTDQFCRNINRKKLYFQASKWDDNFTISKQDCSILYKDVSDLKKKRFT